MDKLDTVLSRARKAACKLSQGAAPDERRRLVAAVDAALKVMAAEWPKPKAPKPKAPKQSEEGSRE